MTGGGECGAEHQVGVCGGGVRSQLVPEVAELGEGHLPAELHHLPEHLLHCRHRTRRTAIRTSAFTLWAIEKRSGLTVLLLDQPLLDVADVGEEVADGCDLRRNRQTSQLRFPEVFLKTKNQELGEIMIEKITC